jgi:hypothetical protein
MSSWKKRTRSATKPERRDSLSSKRRKTENLFQRSGEVIVIPKSQSALILHAIRQPYSVTEDHEVPALRTDTELLVKVEAVGLNPIDWKAPYVYIPQVLHLISDLCKGLQLWHPCLTVCRRSRACGCSRQSTKCAKLTHQTRRYRHCTFDRLPRPSKSCFPTIQRCFIFQRHSYTQEHFCTFGQHPGSSICVCCIGIGHMYGLELSRY